MDTMITGVILGAVVAAVLIVIKVIDFFLTRARDEKSEKVAADIIDAIEKAVTPIAVEMGKIGDDLIDIKSTTKKTWDLHDKFDEDGRPRWYVPASLPSTLEQISRTCEHIAESQIALIETQKEMIITMRAMQTQMQAQANAGLLRCDVIKEV